MPLCARYRHMFQKKGYYLPEKLSRRDTSLWDVRVLKFDGAVAPRVLKFDSGYAAEGCGGRL